MNQINESHEGEASNEPVVTKKKSVTNPAAWFIPLGLGILFVVTGLTNESPAGYILDHHHPEWGVSLLGLSFLALAARAYFGHLLVEKAEKVGIGLLLGIMFFITSIMALISVTGVGELVGLHI